MGARIEPAEGDVAALPDLRLDGRCVVLTGASQGIGAALADAFGSAGASLVLAVRRLDDLPPGNDRRVNVRCDVRSEEDRARLVRTAVDAFGAVDVLVNNAGYAQSAPAVEELPTDIARTVETNLVGPFRLSQLVGERMLEQGSGSIVNVASLIGVRKVDRYGLATYAASKAGLIALTRELAGQWGRGGVRVNAVAPGWFPTRMTGFLADREQADWVARNTSLGRPGRLEEMVGPVLFLAGDASSYVTGQVLLVDGGWL